MLALITPFVLAAFLQTAPQTPPGVPTQTPGQSAVAAPEYGSISGRVTNAVTGEPLKKARVTLRRSGSTGTTAVPATDSVVTDASGAFEFRNVYPGDCTLLAARPGFAGRVRASSSGMGSMVRLALASGQKVTDLKLRIDPEGVISGKVVDENGDPARNVMVSALRPSYAQGVRRLTSEGITVGSTNDLGEYRIFGLTPGRYYVQARSSASSLYGAGLPATADRIYPAVYYPGSLDLETAARVEVRAGAEAGNTNFTLRPAQAAKVRGRVVDGASGQPPGRAIVSISPAGSGMSGVGGAAAANAKGEFEIGGLLPGPYTAFASAAAGNRMLSARETIAVGATGLSGLLLRLAAGASLAGTVRPDDATQAAGLDLTKLRVYLRSPEAAVTIGGPVFAGSVAGAGPVPGAVDDQGNFTLENVSAFRMMASIGGLPDGYYLKSASFENQETVDTGFEATGTGRYRLDLVAGGDGAQLDGVVLDIKDQPVGVAMVVLVPADPDRRPARLYKNTDTDQNGQFTLKSIPPGKYLLYAWENVDDGAWFDPEFMARYEKQGESIAFDPQEHKTVNLKPLSTTEGSSH
jgi:hypothetical protein